jgi:short-subunit dehydrogenase
MKKNILLTGHSRWIWKYLYDNLKWNYQIFGFSKTNWYDLSQKSIFTKIKESIWNTKLNFLVLNAGIWEFWIFEDIEVEKYENIINTNLLWNIRLLKILENNIDKDTKIIFIWSIISKKFMKNAAVYQASKFWLRWLAWWLKNEWKKVFLINPKIVDTGFHEWKIKLDKRFTETKLIDILNTIKNIFSWEEKRFEIDL